MGYCEYDTGYYEPSEFDEMCTSVTRQRHRNTQTG